MQGAGEDYYAKDVIVKLDDKESSICMDIATAYPKEATINSYVRSIQFTKGSHITIEDKFDLQTSGKDQVDRKSVV